MKSGMKSLRKVGQGDKLPAVFAKKSKIAGEIVNKVYFIGAGPGDVELITVTGARLLGEAQIVVQAIRLMYAVSLAALLLGGGLLLLLSKG